MRWHDDDALLFFLDGCVCIEVKYLQDGCTKIQTHAMTWRCVAFFHGWLRLYRGKIFARWVYPYTNARDDMTTMRCFFLDGCVCILVKYLQDGCTKIQTHAMTWRCVAVFTGWMRLYRGKIFAGLQKYQRTRWHDYDALLFSGRMRLYRGKIFARWAYKNTNARDDMTTMRCFFSWMDACV